MEDAQKVLRKRKPFRLLAKMNKDEIAQFRHFLASPLIHAKPDPKLLDFFEACCKLQLWNTELDKAGFERGSKLSFTDNAFDKMVSKLYSALSVFAGLVEFLADPQQQAPFALRFYESKNIELVEIGKKVKESKRELNQAPQNETYFRTMLELELESAELSNSRAQSPEERGLNQLHGHLNGYFFIMKLRLLCATANEERIFGSAVASEETVTLLPWLRAMYETMPALAKIYFHAYHVLSGIDDQDHVREFHQQLEAWEAQFGSDTSSALADLNVYLLNYYLRKLNAGELEALPQAHRFYMDALRKGWILAEGKLSPEHFKNIITTHYRLNLGKEGRKFLEEYRHLLSDNHGGALMSYSEALLNFTEGKYEEMIPAVESLLDAKGSIKADQYYGIDFRCLLLKAYFERLGGADLAAWDSIDEKLKGLLHAFPSYVARKDLPRLTQLRFDNFRKSLLRLYSIAYDTPLKERSPKMKELLREFRSSSNLPDKGWFIQKAIEFGG